MTTLVYKFELPDEAQPIKEQEQGFGPSGELIEFIPPRLNPADILGQKIIDYSPRLGSYGMGGPAFFGLDLGNEWLIIPLWGAAEWMCANGRCVEDTFFHRYDRPKPWLYREEDDGFSEMLIGAIIKEFDIKRHSMALRFDRDFDLTISPDPNQRPIREGSGKPRKFKSRDDLRRAVFLSPTPEIWI